MAGAVAVIIGRAGSKGLPGKNVREIAGRACVCWAIDDALQAERVGRVVVSTDSEPLADMARTMGVEVVVRPAELAQDSTPVDAAVRHAVAEVGAPGASGRLSGGGEPGVPPGVVAILYANVPVRPPGLIDRALSLLEETGADSVQSYAPVGKHHPLWTAVVGEAGLVRPWQGDTLNAGIFRRQDLPPAHVPDGGVIGVTREALFLECSDAPPGPHAFLGADRRGVLTGEGDVIDIDTEIDALVADVILRRRAPAPAGAAP